MKGLTIALMKGKPKEEDSQESDMDYENDDMEDDEGMGEEYELDAGNALLEAIESQDPKAVYNAIRSILDM